MTDWNIMYQDVLRGKNGLKAVSRQRVQPNHRTA